MKTTTGCPDQICHNFKMTLLHNQKTCRRCKDSFGFVRNRAVKNIFRYYDLGPSLDLLKWGLVEYGVFQTCWNKGIL